MSIDGVLLGIMNSYFRAAAEAAGYTLERTAYTTFIKESQDFTTGLITPTGTHFSFPVAIGAQSYVGIDFSHYIDALAPWEEGDVGIANCPFSTRGVSTHLPDYHLLKPIFAEGELLGFAWAFIHSSDMGGIVAGSIQPSAYEMFQEGLRIAPVKLYRRGQVQEDTKALLLNNVRIPHKNWGDLNAVLAGLSIAEVRMHDAVSKWGLDNVRAGRDALIDYTEQRTRAIIRTIPPGRRSFEDYLEDDFVSNVPVRIKLAIEKDGEDGLHFDFTGSDPQVAAAFNLATNGRHPFLCLAMFNFFRTLDPQLPVNGGLIRPFRFTAPKGSIVNAEFPAATGVRYAVTQLIFTIVQGVLAQLFPGRVPAAGAGQATIPAISVMDPASGQRQITVVQPMIGGSGGRPWDDGVDGSDISLGSLRNTPCESLEHEAGLRVLRYELVPDSGGPGQHRGGMALRLDVRLLHPDTIFTARGMERSRFQPWGLDGGRPGTAGECWLNPGSPQGRNLGKVNVERLSAGDVVSLRTPAGGGWNDPWARDPESVLDDVLDGFVSPESARADYGVVVENGALDVAATDALRQARQAQGDAEVFDFGAERSAYMRQFPANLLDHLSQRLLELPQSLRYRAKQVAFTAMRASGRDRIDPAWLDDAWQGIEQTLRGGQAGK
ncbi:hydantoinase B/oxoprolinase family protein [Bordetella petrii]|nr:hydantoinase B/oxoprolinase family protein [Bordetella petrii]